MSLNRRNIIAFILILFAAVCWTFGQQMLYDHAEGEVVVTTSVIETVYPSVDVAAEEGIAEGTTQTTMPNLSVSQENAVRTDGRAERFIGMTLSFAAIAAAGTAIFVFAARNPIFGPDGICLAPALLAAAYHISLNIEYILWGSTALRLTLLSEIVCVFVVLLCVRELFGWMKVRFSLSWCLVQRIAQRCTAPQLSLLVFVAWIMLPLVGLAWFRGSNVYEVFWICVVGFIATSTFGFLCLWKYGKDLNHFKKQLNNYQNGKPITVGDGAFAQTEAQLLDVQAQHEEAVRTAVTSERFKVELISNVSHDLRTPLTSILGYSELLQNETLSPDGREQLRRLHQKAGYMNDLVESLFELTKVSSGVVESKKEQIDLVRLMEQTIGLFDDQLVSAGLVVKRSYCADTIPAI
ncbi:MAG: HAMP domain-containing histidine kinase, partial [Oscillospiraceae bacterium]|nr:HAMP domain-containing histidine kinase [Oscillospiraceae bacterium]